jgi:hypothetical protein
MWLARWDGSEGKLHRYIQGGGVLAPSSSPSGCSSRVLERSGVMSSSESTSVTRSTSAVAPRMASLLGPHGRMDVNESYARSTL